MIKRIVKLTFKEELVQEFKDRVFEPSKGKIRVFPGCRHMELLGDAANPCVLFTLSIWEDESDLENYRQSALFQDTWAKTKALFGGKPEAWTVQVLDDGE